MARTEQLKLAIAEDERLRRRREERRRANDELDEQIAHALGRIEATLKGGQDVHKWLADEMSDDEQQVSVTSVYDWLSRRNNRRPPADLVAIIYEHDPKFAEWWNTTAGYTVPSKIARLTWEEERALYRKMLQEFGAVGEQKLRTIDCAKPEPTREPKEWERFEPLPTIRAAR